MTYDEFLVAIRGPLDKNGERLGQRAFNILYRNKPELAETVRGEAYLDPFYSNMNMTRFLAHVRAHWNDA